MLPDRVSNPGPLTYESGALPIALRGPARIRKDPLKHFEISVLRHIRFVVLNKKQLEQPNFTNDYVI